MEAIKTRIDEIQLEIKRYCKYCWEELEIKGKSISVHAKTDDDLDVTEITKECLPELLEEEYEDSPKNICVECFENIDDLYKCKRIILEEIEKKKTRNKMELDLLSKSENTTHSGNTTASSSRLYIDTASGNTSCESSSAKDGESS